MSIVIVAIPREEDPVWKYSSEKIPHMTLLYLGDGPLTDEENVVKYIQHVAATSLHEFGLSKDRRGRLGPDNADVLFFEKGWENKEIERVRSYLLKNEAIAQAYLSAKQYNGWTPHLTMGYPTAPAKNPENAYELNYIQFDRIAIWFGDSEGPEFDLKRHDDIMPMEHGIGDLLKGAKKKLGKTDDFVRDAGGKFAKTAGKAIDASQEILDDAGNVIVDANGKVVDALAYAKWAVQNQLNKEIIKDTGDDMDWDGEPDSEQYPSEDVRAPRKKTGKTKGNFNPKAKIDESQVIIAPKTEGRGKIPDIVKPKNKVGKGDPVILKPNKNQDKELKKIEKQIEIQKMIDEIFKSQGIKHSGVKGMKWGVRKGNSTLAPRYLRRASVGDSQKLGKGLALNAIGPGASAIVAPLATVYHSSRYEIRSGGIQLNKIYKQPGHDMRTNQKLVAKYDKDYQKMVQTAINRNHPAWIAPIRKIAEKRAGKTADNEYKVSFHLEAGKKKDRAVMTITSPDKKRTEEVILGKVKHADEDPLQFQFEIVLDRDADGFIEDFSIPAFDAIEQSDTSSDVDEILIHAIEEGDSLFHFGTKGMKWGVRRRTGPDGLVRGIAPGLLKGKSKNKDPLADVIRKAEKGKDTSEDHKRLVKDLEKTVSSLSTADINAINARIKSVQKLKENTDAAKAAKASFPKKLLKFALNSATSGVKTYADDRIKELTEDVLGINLGQTRAGKARARQEAKDAEAADKKAREETKDDSPAPQNHPNFTTAPGPTSANFGEPSPERRRALETLADQIARQNG